ncbi:hypothetical protein DSO57_1016155 [Entomophthora muscae]|uniref:Uncharacterized protein n=1 Tax=Entomophthora muscae TaxID=34485 RepID=A0ACC2U395_9FUNG|nr:hypothetical protein DSO57_1016155 [Entomophthora muscae]
MGYNPKAESWAMPTGGSYNSESTRPSLDAIPDKPSGLISQSFRNTQKESIESFSGPGITPYQEVDIHTDQSTKQPPATLLPTSIDSEVYVGSFFDLEKTASLKRPPTPPSIYSLGIIPSPYQVTHTIPNAHKEAPSCNWETPNQTNWDDPWLQEPVTPKQDKWSLWDDDVSSKAAAQQNSTSNHIPYVPGINSFGVERSLQVSSSLQVENDSKEWREHLMQKPSFKGERVNSTWEIVQQVGRGSFGEVFLGVNIVDPHQPTVAIKRETTASSPPRLEREYEIYQMLAGYDRVPKIHFYGLLQDSTVLVMDLLGPTIKHLRAHSARIRLSAVLEIGIQLLDIMEHIHIKGVAYRDVKPDNFLLDLGCACFSDSAVELSLFAREYFFESETYDPTDELPYFFDLPTEARPSPTLYAVDFGLSEKLQDPTRLRGLSPGSKIRKHTGTAKYASLSTHRGYVAGPLDDLESVGYVLVDLLNGELPWDRSVKKGLRSHNIWFSVERAKRRTRIPTLCHHLPEGFIAYFTYVREASRGSPPDYQFLRSVLRNIYTEKHPLTIVQDLSD